MARMTLRRSCRRRAHGARPASHRARSPPGRSTASSSSALWAMAARCASSGASARKRKTRVSSQAPSTSPLSPALSARSCPGTPRQQTHATTAPAPSLARPSSPFLRGARACAFHTQAPAPAHDGLPVPRRLDAGAWGASCRRHARPCTPILPPPPFPAPSMAGACI